MSDHTTTLLVAQTPYKPCEHKFVFMRHEGFYYQAGRYEDKYVSTDYFFCEKCLENKEVTKQHSGHPDADIPNWCKVIRYK